MLVAALVISTQTARIRDQAAEAMAREARNETLYRLSRRLAGQGMVFDVARVAAEYAEEVFQGRVVIFLPQDGKINFPAPVLRPSARSQLRGAGRAVGVRPRRNVGPRNARPMATQRRSTSR